MAFSTWRTWWRAVIRADTATTSAPAAPAAAVGGGPVPPVEPGAFAEAAVRALSDRASVPSSEGAADLARQEARFVLRAVADVSALVLYLLEGGTPDEELFAQLTARGVTDAQLEAAALAYNPTHDPVADGRLAVEATLHVWLAARNAPGADERAEARGYLNDIRLTATPTMRDRQLLFAYLYGSTESSWGARGRGRAALGHVRLAGVEADSDEPPARPRAPGQEGLSEALLLAADFSAGMDALQERYLGAPDEDARAAALAGVQRVTDLLTDAVVERGRPVGPASPGTRPATDAAALDARPTGTVEDNAMAALTYTVRVWRVARNSPDAEQRATARAYLDEIRALTSASPGDRHRQYAAALTPSTSAQRGRAPRRAGTAPGDRPRLTALPEGADKPTRPAPDGDRRGR